MDGVKRASQTDEKPPGARVMNTNRGRSKMRPLPVRGPRARRGPA